MFFFVSTYYDVFHVTVENESIVVRRNLAEFDFLDKR